MSSLFAKPPETRLSIYNDSTLIDQSLQNEMVDLDAVRNMSSEVQSQYNIDKKGTLKKTSYVHALDRKQLCNDQRIMEISPSKQFNFAVVYNADQTTLNGLIELHTELVSCFDNPLATPKNF